MRSILIFLGLLISITGCSHLILKDYDSPIETTAKVSARVLLAPITLGLSEVRIAQVKAEYACEDDGGWYFMGACRENSEANRNRAMMLMPAMMNANAQYFNRPLSLPTPITPVIAQPLPRQPLNCVSRTYLGLTQTTCN